MVREQRNLHQTCMSYPGRAIVQGASLASSIVTRRMRLVLGQCNCRCLVAQADELVRDMLTRAGHKVKEADVIKLVGGGTGFAGREGQKLQSEKQYTLGPGSGRADLRGQAASGVSRFGLSFQN